MGLVDYLCTGILLNGETDEVVVSHQARTALDDRHVILYLTENQYSLAVFRAVDTVDINVLGRVVLAQPAADQAVHSRSCSQQQSWVRRKVVGLYEAFKCRL
ncbi:hypothetical protein EMEDMD4_650005 [Sinorhizobium medicae]|uniref:Uncharacterized protein n=1 Tax=Sinorhizobium medicae TaxID=110321 RepID=A0A508X940_9HYPH|nr:hypothetical protein EMEDMD4_650005 [Sinorhizobium medicae]